MEEYFTLLYSERAIGCGFQKTSHLARVYSIVLARFLISIDFQTDTIWRTALNVNFLDI